MRKWDDTKLVCRDNRWSVWTQRAQGTFFHDVYFNSNQLQRIACDFLAILARALRRSPVCPLISRVWLDMSDNKLTTVWGTCNSFSMNTSRCGCHRTSWGCTYSETTSFLPQIPSSPHVGFSCITKISAWFLLVIEAPQ